VPLSAEQRQLIHAFEPVLYFYGAQGNLPAERFFPSDAKRYLERCALWKASDPVDVQSSWGAGPAIEAGEISASSDEPGAYIARKSAAGDFEFLETPADKECFLDLGGWKPATHASTGFLYADLDRIAELYASDQFLRDSQFWYHAEFFDQDRLRRLFSSHRAGGGQDFAQLFTASAGNPVSLKDPALICYYMFFPGHDEGIADCRHEFGDRAAMFASFAGEWTCVAVLLDRPTPFGNYAPLFVGLSNRNSGIVKLAKDEVRVGLRVLPWGGLPVLGDTHLQLAVARGSHAFYTLGEVPDVVAPLTKQDPSRNYCGYVDLSGRDDFVSDAPTTQLGLNYVFAKAIGGAGVGAETGLLVGAGVGLIAGIIWGIAEWVDVEDGGFDATPREHMPAVDVVSGAATAGTVVHTGGVVVPDVSADRTVAWRSKLVHEVDGRKYSCIVDREPQPLWPGDPDFRGFTGRWGQRVQEDAQTRRMGMRFPNFWLLFFEALVRTD
jgi:hypothetical protein